MLNPRFWLFIVAIIAGIACGRSLHAEDCGCDDTSAIVTVDASYEAFDDGYDANGIKSVYGPEEIRYQYIPTRFCDAPAYEPTHEIVIVNPNDYGRWGRGVYPHRYDTGMGLGGTPGETRAGYVFRYGLGTVDPVTHEPVGGDAGSGSAGSGGMGGSGAGGGGGVGGLSGMGSSPGSGR